MGVRIRRQRRRCGLTLDDLAQRTGISKPYLSLIETGRTPNPPSDEKLIRIERVLGFKPGELIAESQLHRTPRDVRAMLTKLLAEQSAGGGAAASSSSTAVLEPPTGSLPLTSTNASTGISLDALHAAGLLRQFVERTVGNVERLPTNAVPVINRVSAGYPKDFTDLSYPKGAADAWVSCPDVADPDAFAARVSGDSMSPKYREGDIVIFSPKASVRDGDDAFVRFADGQTTFKRVFFQAGDDDVQTVRLEARNAKYAPKVVASEELSGIWRAVFKYQSVEESGES